MNERLFLYIDILGFSDMSPKMIEKVYRNIDELRVHGHAPYFKCIVFSDTILVYSSEDWAVCEDRTGAIMWMCEFAQDLFYRLIGKDIHFRAILTRGEFKHATLKNIDAFYGDALVRTYRDEKNVVCMGLMMDKSLVPYSDIFKTDPYDKRYHFVHIMQNLLRISFKSGYPIDPIHIVDCGLENLHAYDLVYIKNVYTHMTDPNMLPHHRAKYQGTWQMLRTRSASLLDAFVNSGFDARSVCDFDWSKPLRLVGTRRGFFG
jgi:hypothetical protein